MGVYGNGARSGGRARVLRVAAIHDLSGAGRCSLGVVLPVLTAMGVCVNPAVTAYLSAHTGYPPAKHAVCADLTAALAETVRHWTQLGLRFDAVYSGYLANADQAAAVEVLMDANPAALAVVDPVLGDRGARYRGISDDLVAAMQRLSRRADVVTPNLTECALLLGEPYDGTPSEPRLRQWAERLAEGRRTVVVTGVRPTAGRVGCAVLDGRSGRFTVSAAPEAPGHYPGTGDLFAAVLTGWLLRGEDAAAAALRAAEFTAACAAYSYEAGGCEIEGVHFAPLLGALAAQAAEMT